MDFIQTINKFIDKFGPGKHGFSPGNKSLGIDATYVSPEFLDDTMMEIINVIEAGGISPGPGQRNQMLQSINTLISNAISAAAGNDYKASVRAATTANIANLAGGAPNTLDGVTLAANDRILVKDQTTGSQNGIYVVTTLGTGANGTWTRATDADGVGELTSGAVVAVEEGTTNADSQWMLTTNGTITIGTTALAFARKDVPPGLLAVSGYQKLPGGLIVQWGQVTVNASSSASVSWPTAFPNNFFTAYTGRITAGAGGGAVFAIGSPTLTGAIFYNPDASPASTTEYFLAIGN